MYTGFWKLCYQFFSLSTCYLEKLASNRVQHHHHPQARVAWLRPPPSYYFHVPTLSVDFHSADNLKTLGQKTLKNFQIAFSFSPNFSFRCLERGFVHINFSRVWVHTVIKNSVWKSYIEGNIQKKDQLKPREKWESAKLSLFLNYLRYICIC